MKKTTSRSRRASTRDSISRVSSRSRSRSDSRTRATSRRGSIASVESFLLHEENNHEIYSGAGSEVIPSSITSFHYPHSLASRARKQSEVSRETSPLLQTQANDIDLESVKSHATYQSSEEAAHFRFFNVDDIEAAPGGSTLENNEEPIDYNTEWEYPVDKFEEEELPEEAVEDAAEPGDQFSVASSEFERRRRTSVSSDNSAADLLSGSEETTGAADDENDSKTEYQRYYLAEEDLVIGIAGYRDNLLKQCLFYFICISTLGLGYLLLRWLPRYRINLLGDKSPLGRADWCVIENEYGELTIAKVERARYNERLSNFLNLNEEENEKDPIVGHICAFKYRYLKFFYNPIEDIFKTNGNWYDSRWLNAAKIDEGVSQSLQEERMKIFDDNSIDIEDKSIFTLLVEEVLHPFYVFQIFSILLWLVDDYYYYASCIFLISLISIVNTLIETKMTVSRLKEISRFSTEIRVWRNEFWKTVDSDELVPGDVFEVDPSLSLVPCDCLLINGECVINESMLTGESVPITKSTLKEENLDLIMENFIHPTLSKSYLFNGTKILKRRTFNEEPVKALVVKTGFNTTKGSLIRSMLFPKPVGFKFYQDSFKYIGFMTIIAFLGFIYSTINFIELGVPTSLMILRALDIITIVVPPALPATLTIGTTFALGRLKKHQIYCISPTRVNVGGKLDVICFDKTGTLTEDGLDVLGVHLVNNADGRKEAIFEDLSTSIKDINTAVRGAHDTNNGPVLIACMSTCHSLTLVDDILLGDPLDNKMFDFTNSSYGEKQHRPTILNDYINTEYSVVKEFEFEASIRRMSVLAEAPTSKFLFCKGAPEVMMDICKPESLPVDFKDLLHKYTSAGYRVIGCSYKDLDAFAGSRESFENDLEFLGFIVFENKLKAESKSTIVELKRASIRTIMCTGDNILTAISVGKECELLPADVPLYIPTFTEDDELIWEDIDDENNKLDARTLSPLNVRQAANFKFAVTGHVFKYLLNNFKDTEYFYKVLLNCDIFSRMSPDEKHELVNQLQNIDYTVGFIGDGANDCGALKAANVGVSLSEAEASIAAPFTSRIFEVSCLLNIIKEGRSSLVTSFSSFKFMSLYSAVQFITVTILYKRGTNLGDFQFLYIDLFLILPLAIFMSWSKPSKKLIVKRPTANLVSMKILMTLVLNIVILLIFQVVLWRTIQGEPWYEKPVPGDDENVKSYDNSLLFLFSNLQYILISAILTAGPPYRCAIKDNKPYLANLMASVAISVGLFFIDSQSFLGNVFQLVDLKSKYYTLIVLFAIVNYLALWACEKYVYMKLYRYYKRLRRSQVSKKKYKNLSREFRAYAVV